MDVLTRNQLLALSEAFYSAHAAAFDASRGHHAWPGWQRLLEHLPTTTKTTPTRVLDIGCGNARLARFLHEAGCDLDYVGIDANADLLAAAKARLTPELVARFHLHQQDVLPPDAPDRALPPGPFALIALMGLMHHVPGQDWRLALLRAAAARLAEGGVLAVAVWQFADRSRFARRRIAWEALGPVAGAPIDAAHLEAGDHLLRFGDDPDTPPRYCHQVSGAEFDSWPSALGLTPLADFRADGAEGDLNRYWILRRP